MSLKFIVKRTGKYLQFSHLSPIPGILILNNLSAWSDDLGIYCSIATDETFSTKSIISSDGINWTITPGTIASTDYSSMVWGAGKFVLLEKYGNNVLVSPDGTTWTTYSNITSNEWSGLIWVSELNLFVATGQNDTVMTSSDGIHWNTNTSASGYIIDWYDVVWSDTLHLFFAIGATQEASGYQNYAYSSDATSWTTIDLGEYNALAVDWSHELGIFMMICVDINTSDGFIFTSRDGIDWTLSNELGYTIVDAPSPGSNYTKLKWAPVFKSFILFFKDGTSPNIIMHYARSYDGVHVVYSPSPFDPSIYEQPNSKFIYSNTLEQLLITTISSVPPPLFLIGRNLPYSG